MNTIFVAFSDASETSISSVFGCAQDTSAFPYQGSVGADDSRYKEFYESIPAPVAKEWPTPA